MMKEFHPTKISAIALAWLFASLPLAARPFQDVPPDAKPVPAEASAKRGSQARANRAVLEPVAFEQARYVKRLAQLKRIKQIAAEKNNDQLNQQAEALRVKNEQHHADRLAALRAKHGEEQVNAALVWIERRVAERGKLGMVRGAKDKQKETGAVVDGKTREEAKQLKQRTDAEKEKAKQKPQGETKP